MRPFYFIGLLIVLATFSSCDKNEDMNIINRDFEFIAEYTATITVGGVVGITERTFKIGEVYKGIDKGEKTITIRIAEHVELNEDCPNSSCYQEFLSVPREVLMLVR